jgi:hypothetical protein
MVSGRLDYPAVLAELEMQYVEAEGGIEDSDTVEYNSFTNLKNYASVNYDGDCDGH